MNIISSSATGLILDLVLAVPPWVSIPVFLIGFALTRTKHIVELVRVVLDYKVKKRELDLALSTKDLSSKQATRVQETLQAMRSSNPPKEP